MKEFKTAVFEVNKRPFEHSIVTPEEITEHTKTLVFFYRRWEELPERNRYLLLLGEIHISTPYDLDKAHIQLGMGQMIALELPKNCLRINPLTLLNNGDRIQIKTLPNGNSTVIISYAKHATIYDKDAMAARIKEYEE